MIFWFDMIFGCDNPRNVKIMETRFAKCIFFGNCAILALAQILDTRVIFFFFAGPTFEGDSLYWFDSPILAIGCLFIQLVLKIDNLRIFCSI